ncbi:MAG: N-formylglutamate amidohydrolase [Bacillota bacterium]
MKRPLPLILSVPHGGSEVPAPFKDNFRLTPNEVLDDGDLWTAYLFDLSGDVLHASRMPVARAVLDLNRAPKDRPPKNQDGVVKSHSLRRAPVWRRPLEDDEVEWLLKHYYHPYYETLIEASSHPEAKLGIDCHSMLPRDPFDPKSPKRPMFCLSNRGNQDGEACGEPLSAPAHILHKFKSILERAFEEGAVSINQPFKGGELTRRLGQETKIPWFQFEINRELYAPHGVEGPGEWDYALYDFKTKLAECLRRLAKTL